MAFNMTIWENTGGKLAALAKHKLDSEDRLETWIEQDSSILGLDVLIIGRQVRTPYSGRIDLLAIDYQGNLVIIELKRDRTPREVVAQVLDYASWVHGLSEDNVLDLASTYLTGRLADVFANRFGTPLPAPLNHAHRMVIVASELDDSSERIVQYLSSVHSLDINVVFFTCFMHEGKELVGRSWLMDPAQVEDRNEGRAKRTNITVEDFLEGMIGQRGEAEKAVAERVIEWSGREGLEPGFSKTSSTFSAFIPTLKHRDERWYPISLQTTGQVVLQMQWLKLKPPFDAKANQTELLNKLNEIPGVAITEDRIGGRPGIRLALLLNQPALDRLLAVLRWVVAQIRAS
jgi:hypothetical protein